MTKRKLVAFPGVRHPNAADAGLFENWWEGWTIKGTKRGKLAAHRAYLHALRHTDRDTLVAGLRRYMDHCAANGIDAKYIKHPIRWLRDGCWDDEY